MRRPFRLAFVGGCQVAGMASTARRLRPDLDIQAYHVGVPLTADQIAEQVEGCDVIITQFEPGHAAKALIFDVVQSLTDQAVLAPIFRFTGLHPDLAYIPHDGGVLKGVGSDYHSLLVAASFGLGLDPSRVEKLFNPAVFSGLGYFDVYAAARAVMEDRAAQGGLELGERFDAWREEATPFMHTFNHPGICVLRDYALLAMVKAGLVDPGATAPNDIEDELAASFIAPVFPSIARRCQVRGGGSTFQLPAGNPGGRSLSLADFIGRSYALYANMNRDILDLGRIPEMCERLAQILA